MTRSAGTALLCGLLFLLSAVAARADKRVALVIGNSAYQHAPALANPARDARAMAAMFQKAGFDVVRAQYDVGNLQFKRAIRQFEDAVADADIAVVYFAGHGIEIHGVNYLIPVDARLASDRDADDEAITLERLLVSVEGARRLRLVILDACRDNPFVRKMLRQRSAAIRGVNPGLATVEPSSINTLIAYAAKAGSAADDGDAEHSPFTAALLDNLFVPGLDVRLAFGRVRDEVLKKTGNQQEPFVYGSLGGANIALVPAPKQGSEAVADLEAERSDYNRVEKLATRRAWEIFLAQYPTGFYADLARENLAALDRAEAPQAQAEKDRLAREQAEQERLAKERAEQDRLAREQAEQERLAKERAEQDRLAREQAEKDRLAREQAEKDRLAKEQAERDRLVAEQAERDRLEQERAAKEQAERQRLAAEQAERDRLERERVAKAQAERERLAREQAERDRLAQEQAERDKAAAAAQEKADATAKARADAVTKGDDTNAPPAKTAMMTPPTEPPPPKPADVLSGGALVEAIKKELKRVGCYSGRIDDNWTSAETKSSVGKFVKYAKLPAAPGDPDFDFLVTIRGKSTRVCPLECSVREVEQNGRCVVKECRSGYMIDDQGSCIRRRNKTASPSHAKGSVGAPKKVATGPYDPADRSRRITPGGVTTCGPRGCERVPIGCQAVRGAGGHGLGGRIICP